MLQLDGTVWNQTPHNSWGAAFGALLAAGPQGCADSRGRTRSRRAVRARARPSRPRCNLARRCCRRRRPSPRRTSAASPRLEDDGYKKGEGGRGGVSSFSKQLKKTLFLYCRVEFFKSTAADPPYLAPQLHAFERALPRACRVRPRVKRGGERLCAHVLWREDDREEVRRRGVTRLKADVA